MSKECQLALVGTFVTAALTAAVASLAVPQAVRITLGLPMVVLLPGFAVVCAVLPDGQLSRGERLLASLGISLAIATCTAVLLAATPIGLSRGSFAAVLGGGTAMVCIYAWFRTHFGWGLRGESANVPDDIRL